MWAEYKAFLFRGNVMDLAVAFILGVAFAAVVDSFTHGILMAFIAAIFGEPSFDRIVLAVGDGQLLVGSFLTALVNFVIVGTALFLILRAATRFRPPAAEEPTSPDTDEVVILREIRDALRAGR